MRRLNTSLLFVIAPIFLLLGTSSAQTIRLRTANRETAKLIRSMLDQFPEKHEALAGRVDVQTWGSGFVRFAEGACDILVENRWPNVAEMKKLSWGIGTKEWYQEFIVGQRRIVVVVNKANPIKSVSLDMLTKMLSPDTPSVTWNSLGGEGKEIQLILADEKSQDVSFLRNHLLKKEGKKVIIPDISTRAVYVGNGKVSGVVQKKRNAIGFLPATSWKENSSVRILPVVNSQGRTIQPNPSPAIQKDYPLSQWIVLYLHPKSPKDGETLCRLLAGPVVAGVVAETGFTTPTDVETHRNQTRIERAKSGKGAVVQLAGSTDFQKMIAGLAKLFSGSSQPIKATYRTVNSWNSRGLLLADGKMTIFSNTLPSFSNPRTQGLWKEAMPVPFVFGSRSVGVVVNGANGLKSISVQSLAKVYTGEAKDWVNIGPTGLMAPGKGADTGNDQYPITAYGLSSRLPAGALFDAKVFSKKDRPRLKRLASTVEVIKAVRANPGAIGIVDLTQLPEDIAGLRILPVDQVYPTATAIQAGKYPLVQPVYLYVNPKASEPTKRFVEFITTTGKSVENPYTDTIGAVTKTLLANGLLPVTKQSIDKLPRYIQSQSVDREEEEPNPKNPRKKQPGKSAGGW